MKFIILILTFFSVGFMTAQNPTDSFDIQSVDSLRVNSITLKDSVTILSSNTKIESAPKLYPNWTLYVPGGTHFYEKRVGEGIVFSGLTVGGLLYGLINNDKIVGESSSPYSNFPLLIGLQAYNVDKVDFFRNRMEYLKYQHPDFRYDPIKYNDLLLAPFKPKNVFTPITGAFVAIAVAELFLLGPKPNRYLGQVDQMMVMNRFVDRNQALGLYGGVSLAASYGAGVAEEYVFRNALMPIMDYRYGQRKGLIYSSLIFGGMHLTNLFMSQKPDYVGALIQVAEASLAGYLLGNDVQKRGYDIGPAVAAHMWYDFVLMLGSFLVNPQNNFLGVSVSFRM